MAEETLLGLQDELTCSICLSLFENPVTTPCGHNFCQSCLDLTWKDSEQVVLGYNCPQCRTHYYTKPELKKNTVLSNVAEKLRIKSESSGEVEVKSEPKVEEVLCDTCRETKALKTCLTCMASFCEEHLRPHLENPIFSTHQLNDPLRDLRERICPGHHKLMDCFCETHRQCVCAFCIPLNHNGCSLSTLEERRKSQESELKRMLCLLDGKMEKNQVVISQMKEQQYLLKDSAMSRKKALELEYQQIRDLIDKDEQEAMKVVEREQESGQAKMQTLSKRFLQNIQQMKETKEQIESLLDQSQSFKFLQTKVELPSVATFDPYAPRINVDSRPVSACQEYTAGLRKLLDSVFKQPVEKRLPLLKSDTEKSTPDNGQKSETPVSAQVNPSHPRDGGGCGNPGAKKKMQPKPQKKNPNSQRDPSASKTPKQPPSEGVHGSQYSHWMSSMEALAQFPAPGEKVFTPPVLNKPTPSITSAAKRSDLLQYGTVLMLDAHTAHKRIALSENSTKATVSDEPCLYPDGPARFAVCSQVLCTKGFSRGRHYWEVKMSSNNFCGLGLAYSSIDRKGPASRLGRSAHSWCVEWFNVKLSAWHNSSETVLANPNPKRVGIYLDCEEGTATFYSVADRAYPFHTFIFRFTEAVYPAFWIFSSGSSVTLCKLTN